MSILRLIVDSQVLRSRGPILLRTDNRRRWGMKRSGTRRRSRSRWRLHRRRSSAPVVGQRPAARLALHKGTMRSAVMPLQRSVIAPSAAAQDRTCARRYGPRPRHQTAAAREPRARTPSGSGHARRAAASTCRTSGKGPACPRNAPADAEFGRARRPTGTTDVDLSVRPARSRLLPAWVAARLKVARWQDFAEVY